MCKLGDVLQQVSIVLDKDANIYSKNHCRNIDTLNIFMYWYTNKRIHNLLSYILYFPINSTLTLVRL